MKFKKNLENRTEKACYLRKIGSDKYQVWMPETNKITTVRIVDFILQQSPVTKPVSRCNNELEQEQTQGSPRN